MTAQDGVDFRFYSGMQVKCAVTRRGTGDTSIKDIFQGCNLILFTSVLSLGLGSVSFLCSPTAGDHPNANNQVDNSARLGLFVLGYTEPRSQQAENIGSTSVLPEGAGMACASPFSSSLPLPSPLPFSSPPFCPLSSISISAIFLLSALAVVLSLIIIVSNNTALGSATNQKHPRLAKQREQSIILNLKLAIWTYFRSS